MDDNTRKIELARRAVECKRWLAGMRIWCAELGFKRITDQEVAAGVTFAGWLVDLDDPATQGCFERGLIPEAYGVEPDGVSVWIDMRGVWWLMLTPLTESRELACPARAPRSEALVAALEAAPGGGS